jgi:hypothetical protein
MNGLPDAYTNGTHVTVRGRTVVVTEHAPNADSWHYRGSPADLAGDVVTFSHDEATLVVPRRDAPPLLHGVLRLAGLDPDVYAAELAELQRENVEPTLTPLEELLSVVEGIARRGHVELRAALNIYREETS